MKTEEKIQKADVLLHELVDITPTEEGKQKAEEAHWLIHDIAYELMNKAKENELSAKEFLQKKGLMLGDVKDYEAKYRKQGISENGLRQSTFPDLDLVELLTEFKS